MKFSKFLALLPIVATSGSSFAAIAVPGSIHCDQMYLDESGTLLFPNPRGPMTSRYSELVTLLFSDCKIR